MDGEAELTVHYFTQHDAEDDAEKASDPPSQEILANATRLVISTTRDTIWCNPKTIGDMSSFYVGRQCFQYTRTVPRDVGTFLASVSARPAPMQEWDASALVTDDEIWALSELEDFDHHHLHRLLDSPAQQTHPAISDSYMRRDMPSKSLVTSAKHHRDDSSTSEARVTKRSRGVEDGTLRHLLPQPHFHPSPYFPDEAAVPVSTFSAARLSPLESHTLESALAYVEDPFTRLAWIIPIRGRLEWAGASSASILLVTPDDADSHDSVNVLPIPPEPPTQTDSHDSEIVWTRDALISFWNFLEGLREAGHTGPLSLSFHVASVDAPCSMDATPYFGSHKQTTASDTPTHSSHDPSSTSPQTVGSPLASVDHVKIYHDAQYTQYLRKLLGAWSYRRDDLKVRLLKAARLVLVDEHSRGLLLH